jgi:transposase, IS30 family
MVYRTRIKYTAAQRAAIWDRWQRGVPLAAIGRLFDLPSSIFIMLAPTGGILPPPRRRSRLALTLAEREEISRGLGRGLSLQAIAVRLGRAPSTISREVIRNSGLCQRSSQAEQAAWDGAHRPSPETGVRACTRSTGGEPALGRLVASKRRSHWSREQIAGWLKRCLPGEREPSGITRDYLQETVYPGAGRIEIKAAAAPENPECDTSLKACQPERGWEGADLEYRVHPGASGFC